MVKDVDLQERSKNYYLVLTGGQMGRDCEPGSNYIASKASTEPRDTLHTSRLPYPHPPPPFQTNYSRLVKLIDDVRRKKRRTKPAKSGRGCRPRKDEKIPSEEKGPD